MYAPVVVGAALVAASCGSSSKPAATGSAGSSSSSSSSASTAAASSPATRFNVATVSGLGSVLVDGRGHTVYVLTVDGRNNVPCEDSTGCTKVWPDLPLPDGVAAATAGSGVQQSLLSTKKLSDGETYPTYNGWLMYEFVKDTSAGQGQGEGIKSFGGTWYALNPQGALVMPSASTSSSTSSGGGY